MEFDLAGNPRGDMTATSVIFKDPKTGRQMVVDPGVEHLIAQYIIEKDKLVNRVSETSEVGGSEVTFKASDAAKKNKVIDKEYKGDRDELSKAYKALNTAFSDLKVFTDAVDRREDSVK